MSVGVGRGCHGLSEGSLGQRWLQHHSMDRLLIRALHSVTLANLEFSPDFSIKTVSPRSWRVVVLCLFCVLIAVKRRDALYQRLLLRSHFKLDATGSVLKQKSLLTETTQSITFMLLFCND